MENELFKSPDVELVFRLVLAVALGSLIGYERETNKRPATYLYKTDKSHCGIKDLAEGTRP